MSREEKMQIVKDEFKMLNMDIKKIAKPGFIGRFRLIFRRGLSVEEHNQRLTEITEAFISMNILEIARNGAFIRDADRDGVDVRMLAVLYCKISKNLAKNRIWREFAV